MSVMRLLPAVLLLVLEAMPAAQAPGVPAAVMPFPGGLTGMLVFQSDARGADNPQGRPHLFTIDLANGKVTSLTSGAGHRDENARWSPDGRRIAFKSTRGGSNFDLYLMDANGANVMRVTDHPANDHDPVWMPDGQSLVFSSERDSRGDLYRVWLNDRRVERLTHHFVGRAIMPAVSPDGRSVAFAAQSLQRLQFWDYQVHILDLATGKTRGLNAPGGTCWPAWSPDGQWIANVALHQEPSRLEVRSPAGAQSRELRPDPKRWHYYPDWSNDGRQIAFAVSPAHHEGEDWDLAIVAADGSGYQRLTTGTGNDRLPDWRP
jgi:TolB protein